MKPDLLIIGSIPDEKNKLRYGGATVLMKNYLDYLHKENIQFSFIQNNKFSNFRTGKKRTKLNMLFFITRFFRKIWFCKIVMFNFSDNGTVTIFPFLSKFAQLIGKKVILRKFGGSLELFISTKSKKTQQKTFNALRKADLILLETKAGIEYLKKQIGENTNIKWFPNTRNYTTSIKNPNSFKKRCVFISHIKQEKGADILLNIAKSMLDEEYTFDMYGAITETKYNSIDFSEYNITYHGPIPSSEVIPTLLNYDILLLPSYREGYPGIILEALSVGIPVVAFNVGGIPEVIKNNYNGLLVEVGDEKGIMSAIHSINIRNYHQLSANARNSFIENFESGKTNKRITEAIFSLI